jgi:predicted DNA-binding transcriptional regulator AlpA
VHHARTAIVKGDEAQTARIKQPLGNTLEILTSRDLAEILGRHRKTIERHARMGTIPGHFRLGQWYFLKSEIDAWLRIELNSTGQPDRVN